MSESSPLAPEKNPYRPPLTASRSDGQLADGAATAEVRRKTLAVVVRAGVIGAALGVISRWLRPHAVVGAVHYEALASLVALLVTSIVLVYHNRTAHRAAGHWNYQAQNLSLWLGFICLWSFVHGEVWRDFIEVTVAWWFGCAAVGSICLAFLQWRRGWRFSERPETGVMDATLLAEQRTDS